MTYTEEMTTSEILLRLASIRNELLQAVDDIEKISNNICYKAEQTEPIIEVYNGNADKENWQYITVKPIEAEPQTERGRMMTWIPCSKRLPSDDNNYLVVDGDGEMAVGYYRDDADAWDNSCFGWLERDDEDEHPTRLGKVIAWMPLPKPYGEREDK